MSRKKNTKKTLPQSSRRVVTIARRKWTEADLDKLASSAIGTTARIAAIERFVKDLAIRSRGDTPETASCNARIQRYFDEYIHEISNFRHDQKS